MNLIQFWGFSSGRPHVLAGLRGDVRRDSVSTGQMAPVS